MHMPFALEKSYPLHKANKLREGKLKLLEDFEITLTES